MSDEIIKTATIKVVADASGVEAGMRKIEDAAAKTGRTLDNLGRADGFSKLGEGADQAAGKFTLGTKGIIDSIEKRTASMELGKRGTVEYYTALANQKGINPAALKPYLDQLEAVTKKTNLAAEAQRRADDGAKFVEGLRARAAEIGKSASELARMRAAELGVSESAGPLIERLRAAEQASSGLGSALGVTRGALVSFAAGLASAVSIGAFVSSISESITALADLDDMAQKTGSSVETLSRLQKVALVTGQDFGPVSDAVTKLARGMGGLDEDSNKVVSALKRLGVSSKDAAGNLRDPSEVLIDISQAFQKYADGAGKTAVANDLIKGSGADLLPFLNDVAERVREFSGSSAAAAKSASAFKDNMAQLKLRVAEMGLSFAENLLPSLVKFSEYIKELVDSGKFKKWITDAGESVGKFAIFIESAYKVLVPAAKIVGAYFAAFVGGPALFRVVATGLIALYNGIGKVAVAMYTGAGANAAFNTSLFGTSVAATSASGALGKLKIAGGVLFAGFAGWEIGKYLREEFEGVRISGLLFFGAMDTGWENFKYNTSIALEAVSFAWDKTLATMKSAFGLYLEGVGKGLGVFGDNKASTSVLAYANSLRSAGDAQKTFADRTAAMTAAHKAELEAIDENLMTLVQYELGIGKVAEAKKKAADEDGKEKDKPGLGNRKKVVEAVEDTAIRIQQQYSESLAKTVAAAIAEAEAQEDLVRTFGMTKTAIAELTVAREEDRLAQLRAIPETNAEVAAQELIIAAKKRSLAASISLDSLGEGKKALDDLDKFLDPTRAKDFGEALSDAFGSAGSALNKLTNSLTNYGSKQAKIDEARQNAKVAFAKGELSNESFARKMNEINERGLKTQLNGYGQMTDAAAGFFGEQSRGYQALQAASQVFHAAELAMTIAELVPKGISAVLSQGEGDPYSAFARMAAMAAIVAGLGVAIGGVSSSGGESAVDVQKKQGTGGVLGDSSAKSDSISRSLDMIEKYTFQGLDYSAGMLDSLRAIEASMTGLTNLIVRVPGLTNGTNLGIQEGNITKPSILGTLIGGFIAGPMTALVKLWGKTTQNIVDSGIQFGGRVNDLQAGKGFSQYASVNTTKSSWFGLSKSTSNSVQTQGLGSDLSSQFGMVFTGLEETLRTAAEGLGLGANQVTLALDKLVLAPTKISLKDLKGDELTAAVNAVISKAMDDISEAAFPSFQQFRQIGEGYAETVIRVAQNFQAINVVFESFGKVFGQIGLESVAARERLIALSGGLENFSSQGEYFLTNFFSQEEQAAALKKRIQPTLSQFGLSTEGPNAEKIFRDFVVALDTTSEAGARAYVSLQNIAPAFKEIINASSAAQEERNSLQDQLDSLTMSSTQLLKKQRDALSASNRVLFDQIQAATAAKAAQDAAKDSLGNLIGKLTSFGDSAKTLRDSLLTGSLSTLTPEKQYDELRRQFETTYTAAKGGDTKAQSNFSSIATAFLTASQKLNGGDSTYAADFTRVRSVSEEVALWADGQLEVAKRSLDALNAQVIGIEQINATLGIVAERIQPTTPAPQLLVGVPDFGTYGVNMEPMAAEIRALRQEVSSLRQDQAIQTGDLIRSNALATQQAADRTVAGSAATAKDLVWATIRQTAMIK
ncbi:MAG TPA: hypothetical protein VGC21_13610 [Telluria sp.]|jgi:hypothetical protein